MSVELTSNKKQAYSKVLNQSNHGATFSIVDEEDDADEEIQFNNDSPGRGSSKPLRRGSVPVEANDALSIFGYVELIWSTMTFSWIRPLLKVGNTRPLVMEDLYELPPSDTSESVYRLFKQHWSAQINGSKSPSLISAYFHAFGKPFVAAGGLKFIHDNCLFVGPYLLNKLIKYLNDPSQTTGYGLSLVLGLFVANFAMSLCLRQYFWICYRTGMNLRSSVVTSVYSKSLVISAATMSRKSTGEISNLMSVDSTRLQELTPYLHAVWYSFLQITFALVLLWQQMGVSCLSGMAVIILSIPLTGKVSMFMKTLQKELSKVRDERIKLSNEVLNGMKVIKLQAWEGEFKNRILEVREKELAIFRKYTVSQAMSGVLWSTIPIFVSVMTFMTYIALGNQLDVATALTSLALFELLRFPLFMFPMVINNLVEAKVSVERVQSYLLEQERNSIGAYPLTSEGFLVDKATAVWEGGIKRRASPNAAAKRGWFGALKSALSSVKDLLLSFVRFVSCGRYGIVTGPTDSYNAVANPLSSSSAGNNSSKGSNASLASSATSKTSGATTKTPAVPTVPLSDGDFMQLVQNAQICETERLISDLESTVKRQEHIIMELSKSRNSSKNNLKLLGDEEVYEESSPLQHKPSEMEIDENLMDLESPMSPHSGTSRRTLGMDDDIVLTGDRILTLSRISLKGKSGQLISIVGQVGSGKSSVLSALLGNMRIVYGDISLKGTVAYAAQIPFIQNSTLKENILFGTQYNDEVYYRTLEECALLADIKVLPAGDKTEIGERGINLSGGQKARVGLARAVYSDADIYLLDDPLSAVDAHVGQHLFERCIQTLVKRGKCVVLVTNALQFLKQSSNILVLKDGRIAEEGCYNELLRSGKGFTEMISTMKDTGSGGSSLTESSKGGDEETVTDNGHSAGKDDHHKPATGAAIVSPTTPKEPPVKGAVGTQLITTEEREVGNVDYKVYLKWATAAGGASVGVAIVFWFYFGEAVSVFASWWLAYWSENQDANSPWFYLGIYVLINVFVVSLMFGRELYLRLRALGAGRLLFSELLSAVLYAPMAFYDTTPLGRIINRFSKDIYTVDEQIPSTVRGYLGTMAKVTGVILYVSVVTPLFIIGLVPICAFYYIAQSYYIKTSRELTRLESTSRSPIYALFSETLDGLSTLRAYKSEKRMVQRNNKLLDENQKAFYLNFSANCWLAVRLEFAGTLIVTFAALFAVLGRDNNPDSSDTVTQNRAVFAGLAGLSISLALSVTQSLNWTVRMASDLESQMVSVERIKSYSIMKQEADHYIASDPHTSSGVGASNSNNSWPQHGNIKFHNVTMRYREGLPLVLNGLTFNVNAKEKIGIVGRTGAGKSSIVTALLRLVELSEGDIVIDSLNISTLGLNTLRSIMAVIPQDPVLFSGTVRSNLDPFHKYTDVLLWESLQRTLLVDSIKSLDDPVTENGGNFSVGQRQLLCIARALLSRAKIIIMDEATAAVDVETDAVIQKTIRTEFADATCLTVAHRLNTILDSDKVLVMDEGRAAEFDTPQNLLADDKSMFYSLVNNWENSK